MVMGSASTLIPSTKYDFLVTTYGKCEDPRDAKNVEFNPLQETDSQGAILPYQDPRRGRIDGFTSNAVGVANSD